MSEDNQGLAHFFQGFEDKHYQYNPTNNSIDEFNRLRRCKNWPKETKSKPNDKPEVRKLRQKHGAARAKLHNIIGTMVVLYSGVANNEGEDSNHEKNKNSRKPWAQLSCDLGIKPIPKSTDGLRKVCSSLLLFPPCYFSRRRSNGTPLYEQTWADNICESTRVSKACMSTSLIMYIIDKLVQYLRVSPI